MFQTVYQCPYFHWFNKSRDLGVCCAVDIKVGSNGVVQILGLDGQAIG